jgi:uncharacterized protein (TIGR03083 family)
MSDDHASIATLRQAHDAFATLASGLDRDEIRARSYCDEWSAAQVASHIGSGAELGTGWLRAAIDHTDPTEGVDMPAVWDKWNALSPEEQVTQAVAASAAQVAAFESATTEQLEQAHVALFGAIELDGFGLARFRLPELVIHTWDIAVMRDPSARLLGPAVDFVVDGMAASVGWFGRPQPRPWILNIETSGPERSYVLRNGERVTLEPGSSADADGVMRLPAESLIRLVYGRVDDTTGGEIGIDASGVGLDDLRAVFPGV